MMVLMTLLFEHHLGIVIASSALWVIWISVIFNFWLANKFSNWTFLDLKVEHFWKFKTLCKLIYKTVEEFRLWKVFLSCSSKIKVSSSLGDERLTSFKPKKIFRFFITFLDPEREQFLLNVFWKNKNFKFSRMIAALDQDWRPFVNLYQNLLHSASF